MSKVMKSELVCCILEKQTSTCREINPEKIVEYMKRTKNSKTQFRVVLHVKGGAEKSALCKPSNRTVWEMISVGQCRRKRSC